MQVPSSIRNSLDTVLVDECIPEVHFVETECGKMKFRELNTEDIREVNEYYEEIIDKDVKELENEMEKILAKYESEKAKIQEKIDALLNKKLEKYED